MVEYICTECGAMYTSTSPREDWETGVEHSDGCRKQSNGVIAVTGS